MNVEIGTEAPQIPEKEYINWIYVAVGISERTKLLELVEQGLKESYAYKGPLVAFGFSHYPAVSLQGRVSDFPRSLCFK
jgi:hypothetical protein